MKKIIETIKIQNRIDELASDLVTSTGSKAHRIRGQIQELKWVLE